MNIDSGENPSSCPPKQDISKAHKKITWAAHTPGTKHTGTFLSIACNAQQLALRSGCPFLCLWKERGLLWRIGQGSSTRPHLQMQARSKALEKNYFQLQNHSNKTTELTELAPRRAVRRTSGLLCPRFAPARSARLQIFRSSQQVKHCTAAVCCKATHRDSRAQLWVWSLFSTLGGNVNSTWAYCFLLLSSNAWMLTPILTGICIFFANNLTLTSPKGQNQKMIRKKRQAWKTVSTIGTTPQPTNHPHHKVNCKLLDLFDWLRSKDRRAQRKLHPSMHARCFQDLSR